MYKNTKEIIWPHYFALVGRIVNMRNKCGNNLYFEKKILKVSVEIKWISAETCLPLGNVLGLIDLNINSQG